MGKFVRGKEAEQLKLMKDNILIRVIDVPYEEGKIILPGRKENQPDSKDIMKFNGMHPGIVEVVAVSDKAKEAGINEGDIVAITMNTMVGIVNGRIDPVRVDDEVLHILTVNEIEVIMNYYRDRVEKGKATIKN